VGDGFCGLLFSPRKSVEAVQNKEEFMKNVILSLSITIPLFLIAMDPVIAADRSIEKKVVVDASLQDVWNAWTTNEGAQTFFSSQTNIYAKLGAPYEIYFKLNEPYGKQGSEGCRIHSIVPMKLLAFTWNAPPQFRTIREPELHTIVYLRFEELDPQKTAIHFSQQGWGVGAEWDEVYQYFEGAWDIVLGRLKIRFASGPIDWQNPPSPTDSLKVASK
jgi:uncharacterized protein YndB with AHSA1/START domain